MHINAVNMSFESDHHRHALLEDAANFRLAKLARAGRRAASRKASPPVDPPQPPRSAPAQRDRAEQKAAPGNDDANRRYAVPR